MTHRRQFLHTASAAIVALAAIGPAHAAPAPIQITNVSYDPTRELYDAVNPAFALWWKDHTGQTVTFRTSHGGSGAQSRARLRSRCHSPRLPVPRCDSTCARSAACRCTTGTRPRAPASWRSVCG